MFSRRRRRCRRRRGEAGCGPLPVARHAHISLGDLSGGVITTACAVFSTTACSQFATTACALFSTTACSPFAATAWSRSS